MVTQHQVLEFVAQQTSRGRSTAVEEIAGAFLMSSLAARGHLERLWRERLVVTVVSRRLGYRFRLEPGEHLQGLLFRATPRGRQRLAWLQRRDGRRRQVL
jgi:hypothetical protein